MDILLFSLTPLIIAEFIRELFGERTFDVLIFWFLLFFIIAIIQAIFFFMAAYYNEVLAHRVTTDITALLFKRLQNRSMTYLQRYDLGEIMARATNDTRQLNIGLSPAYRLLIQGFIQSFVIVSLFWYFDARFLYLLAVFIPIYVIFNIGHVKKVYPVQKQQLIDFEQIAVIANETFTGIQELKSYSAEKKFISLFEHASSNHSNTIYSRGKIQAFYYPVLIFWVFVGLAGILGFYWILDGSLSIPDFAGILGSFLMFRFLAEGLSWATTESVAAVAASNRLYKMIYEEEDHTAKFGNKSFNPEETRINFSNVWFKYNEKSPEWILKDISFTIEKNSTVVLLGTPGSGKSTINKLIQRLYSPSKGKITIGSIDIENFNNESFVKNVASIEQSPFLYSDSIENNLRFGKIDATLMELERVSELSRAKEFIDKLPEKYQTEIGDRGVKLSGGQRQRLAITRALLLNPSILIMDDASSALDAKTEAEIQDSITYVLKTRTAVITTHRLGIISQADKILLLDEGRIIAQGKHEDLIRTTPKYRRLFKYHYNLPPLQSSKN